VSFTNFLENKVSDHLFGRATYTAPATVYFGLCLGVSEAGVITSEPAIGVNDYARVAKLNDMDLWELAVTDPVTGHGTKTNKATISFPMATGIWGDVSHFFISDAATGGNILLGEALLAPKYVTAGDTLEFQPGDLVITID